jgi:hypothetical protein
MDVMNDRDKNRSGVGKLAVSGTVLAFFEHLNMTDSTKLWNHQ